MRLATLVKELMREKRRHSEKVNFINIRIENISKTDIIKYELRQKHDLSDEED